MTATLDAPRLPRMIPAGVCNRCRQPYDHQLIVAEDNVGLCSRCHTMNRMERDQGTQNDAILEASFRELCPAIYQETDAKLLPAHSFAQIQAYAFNSKGLLCMGESGIGKTRCCWQLLHRLHLDGVQIIALTETQFAQECSRLRTGDLNQWLNRLCFVQLLFLDDIGHVAASNSHLQSLYHVVEQRTSWKRPIIATTQFSGTELKAKTYNHAAKNVDAIVRRLREFSTIIDFSNPQQEMKP